MNISYNWLKEYVNFDLTPEETAAALTSIGLETGGVEEVQTIKGGLEGLVIGEVLTCVEHPNSDHLHITTVNLGEGDPVQIVCGAPPVFILEPSVAPAGSPGIGITMSSSGFENRVNSPLNRSNTSPTAPLRCLAITISAIPRKSFPLSSWKIL